jgi:Protein of unknown function (DUF2690)
MSTSVRSRPLAAVLLFAAALLLPALAWPTSAAAAPAETPASAGSVRTGEVAGAVSATSRSLPTTTRRTADGAVETAVDEAVIERLAAGSRDPCGRRCDGKDPASFTVVSPWGNYYCANDAITVKTKSWPADGVNIELRYSARCRTAWTRGCCYQRFAGFSYYTDGDRRESVYAGSWSTNSSTYTAMLDDAGLLYAACSDTQIGGSPIWSCTGKY